MVLHPRKDAAAYDWRLFAVVAALAVADILSTGRHLTFFYDELVFLNHQPGSLVDMFRPWNTHWSTALFVVYGGVAALFGERSYLPFQLVLMACHVATAGALYAILGRRASRAMGLALTAVLLVLGTAWEDLFWAWQIGFLGACALGTAAMLAALDAVPAWRSSNCSGRSCSPTWGCRSSSPQLSSSGHFVKPVVGLPKAELIQAWRFWRTSDQVELATTFEAICRQRPQASEAA